MTALPITLCLLGLPGSGKDTQAKLLVERYGLRMISTGELIRQAAEGSSEIAARFIKGQPQPDQVVKELLNQKLAATSSQSLLFNAFPLSTGQVKILDDLIKAHNLPLAWLILLEIPQEEAVKRLLARQEGRADDKLPSIQARITRYGQRLKAVAGIFRVRKRLVVVDGRPAIRRVWENLEGALGESGLI